MNEHEQGSVDGLEPKNEQDSTPTEFQPVENPTQPEGGEYESLRAKRSDADFDAEETPEKE